MEKFNAEDQLMLDRIVADIEKRRKRRETRRLIIHLLLSGLMGVWLASAGLNLANWQYLVIVATTQAIYLNARL